MIFCRIYVWYDFPQYKTSDKTKLLRRHTSQYNIEDAEMLDNGRYKRRAII